MRNIGVKISQVKHSNNVFHNPEFKKLNIWVYDSENLILKKKINQQIKKLNNQQEEHILDVIEQNANLKGWK